MEMTLDRLMANAAEKKLATAKAIAALHGIAVYTLADDAGNPEYIATKWALILAEIASRASTQRQVLIAHADTDDAWAQHLVEAAILIITDIGAMADEALGGAVCGTGNDWRFGPLFERDGGAA